MKYDPVNHPKHYVEQSAKLEPIMILRYAPFDLGNAFKYIIRAGHKDDYLQDLKKAKWYLECALETFIGSDDSIQWAYTHFFKAYGVMLKAFPNIPKVSMEIDVVSIIEHCLNEVTSRIIKVECETKNSDQ